MKKLTQLMSIGMLAIAGLGYAGSVAAATSNAAPA